MKTITALVSSFFILHSAFATLVLFPLVNLTGSANNRSILITPDATPQNPLWLGTNLVPTLPFYIYPVGGQVTTNLAPWGYTFRVDGWPRSVHIVVPNTTNTVNVVGLINTNQFAPLNLFALADNITGTNANLTGQFAGNGSGLTNIAPGNAGAQPTNNTLTTLAAGSFPAPLITNNSPGSITMNGPWYFTGMDMNNIGLQVLNTTVFGGSGNNGHVQFYDDSASALYDLALENGGRLGWTGNFDTDELLRSFGGFMSYDSAGRISYMSFDGAAGLIVSNGSISIVQGAFYGNISGGTNLNAGGISTNGSTAGAVLVSSHGRTVFSNDGSSLTNLGAASIVGTLPVSVLPQVQSWTNNGIIRAINSLGQFTMTNTITHAWAMTGTNGHTMNVDQYGNTWTQGTNYSSMTISNVTCLYSNGVLSVAGIPLLTNVVAGNISGVLASNNLPQNGLTLTNLNASQLTFGTLPMAVLPSAIVTNFTPSGVTFPGGVTSGPLTVTNAGLISGNGGGLTNLTPYTYSKDGTHLAQSPNLNFDTLSGGAWIGNFENTVRTAANFNGTITNLTTTWQSGANLGLGTNCVIAIWKNGIWQSSLSLTLTGANANGVITAASTGSITGIVPSDQLSMMFSNTTGTATVNSFHITTSYQVIPNRQ